MKLTPEIVKELLDYNELTGELVWNFRSRHWFKSRSDWFTWNYRFGRMSAFTHSTHGYRQGAIFGKCYAAHRVIWFMKTGEWPKEIDHINGIKDDNRWENLRNVTRFENQKNMKISRRNKSGKIGVFWDKGGKWQANITANKITMNLGRFDSFEAACEMRSIAERNYGFHPNHGRIK